MAKRSRVPAPAIYFSRHDLVPEFSRYIGYLLAYVSQMAQLRNDHALESLDIDSRQFGVLTLIGETEHRSQIAISEHMGLDRTHLVRLIDDLENKGYVSREKDPDDRRFYRLVLMPAGEKALDEAKRLVDQNENEIYEIFSKEERELFHNMLVRLSKERFPGE